MIKKQNIELLAPARNLQSGKIAIDHGADAVYIGAPKFSARQAAGNSLEDIAELIRYAHLFKAKVYVALNTILFDHELEEAEALIRQLHAIKADAIIIQDMGILQMNLPPISIHASTQTYNTNPAKIKFLEEIGIERVILARELSLNEIQDIKAQSSIELEAFIHGALCVSYSGQCYMSYEACGRSANRGECAQFCRLPYSLTDKDGNLIVKDKYLLSPKDLNLSNQIENLIGAGITSFKIEGRLKDDNYVKNIVSFYRKKIDAVLDKKPHLQRSSTGQTRFGFEPDPEKSFQRGFTAYYINGRKEKVISLHTPKSIGEYLGRVIEINKQSFTLDQPAVVNNGDGICFLGADDEFSGTNINNTQGNRIFPNRMDGIRIGTKIYRNFDKAFEKKLDDDKSERKIKVELKLEEKDNALILSANDEDKITCAVSAPMSQEKANDVEKNIENIIRQLSKSGGTPFNFLVNKEAVHAVKGYYPISVLNQLRRNLTENLINTRIESFSPTPKQVSFKHPHYKDRTSYSDNISNRLARSFYENCGVKNIEEAFELTPQKEANLMTCKHCIKYQIDACPKYKNENYNPINEPLFLHHSDRTYQLFFDCNKCCMYIRKKDKKIWK